MAKASKSPVIKCGDKVRDKLTGLEGVVVSIRVLLNGCVQFGIQPKDAEGKTHPDSWFIDWQTLELLEEQVVERTLPPEQFLFITDKPAVDDGAEPSVGRGGPSVRMKAPRA